MSRQMLISLGLLVLAFGSGIGLGLFIGSAPATSDVSEKKADSSSSGSSSGLEAEDRIQANTLLSNRIRELEKELSEQKQDRQTILADRLAFFKKYHEQIRVQPFDQSLKVTPEMAELLGLSKEQQQTVEQHLAQVKSEMDKLEDGNTNVTKQTENSIAFAIPADPKGKALKDELTGLLTADIGGQQANLFMNSDESSFAQQFAGFAETKKEIELTWTKQNNGMLYTVRNNTFGPDGNPRGSSTLSSNGLPTEYQKYLPTDSAP